MPNRYEGISKARILLADATRCRIVRPGDMSKKEMFGTFDANLLSLDNTDPFAKAGLMFRDVISTGSR